MQLPHIEIMERDFAPQASESGGGYVLLQIQSERGPLEPQLVSTQTQLLQRYTWGGYVPLSATNRSAFLAALEVLRGSNQCWIQRVVPTDPDYPAVFSAAHVLTETGLAVVIPSEAVDTSNNKVSLTVVGNFGFATGDAVTLQGRDLPLGLMNGLRYYVRTQFNGATNKQDVWFFLTREEAEDGDSTAGRVSLNDTGSGSFTMRLASGLVEGGIPVPALPSYMPPLSDAFVAYCADPGKGGDNLHITIDVARYPEEGISCAEAVNRTTAAFPVEPGWAGASPLCYGQPVYFLRASDAPTVLPLLNDGLTRMASVTAAAATPYFIGGGDSSHVRLATSASNALASTLLAGLKDAGTGKVWMVPAAATVAVAAEDVNTDAKTIDEATLPHGTRVLLAGDALPYPLRRDTVYYVTRYVAAPGVEDPAKIQLAASMAYGDKILFTGAQDIAPFRIVALAHPETVVYETDDDTLTLKQALPDGTPVSLSLDGVVGGAYPDGLDGDTVYYYAGGKLYASASDAVSETSELDLGDGTVTPKAFRVVPVNTEPQLVDLDGALDYADNVVRLKTHEELGGGYQDWAAGEAVRIHPSGVNSTLPSALAGQQTFYLVPVEEGYAKIMRLTGRTLSSVTDLSEVNLSAGARGTGFLSIVPASAPLDEDTFRINVWLTTTSRYSTNRSGLVEVSRVEDFVCSLREDLQDDAGRNLYIEDRLLASEYIRARVSGAVDPAAGTIPRVQAAPFLVSLGGGSDGGITGDGTITSADLVSGLQRFTDPVDKPLTYVGDGGYTFADYQTALVALAESRGDCLAVLSTPQDLEDTSTPYRSLIEWARATLPSTRFGMVYGPWQKTTDPTLGRTVACPPDAMAIARHVIVDRTVGFWQSVAGTEYGQVNSQGAFVEFSLTELNELYENRINPISKDELTGSRIILGSKNLYSKQSPLNRIYVSKTLNRILTDLRRSLRQFLNRPITPATRDQIDSMCRGYLGNLKGQGGISDYEVICNSINNDAVDEDNLRIDVWIFVRPLMMSERVRLTAAVTAASVTFDQAIALLTNQ